MVEIEGLPIFGWYLVARVRIGVPPSMSKSGKTIGRIEATTA
jgi:hypothetical protein